MRQEDVIKICELKYQAVNFLKELDNFYDYETTFSKIRQDAGREVLEKNLGALSNNKRKKTSLHSVA
jgi:hypothetical protein